MRYSLSAVEFFYSAGVNLGLTTQNFQKKFTSRVQWNESYQCKLQRQRFGPKLVRKIDCGDHYFRRFPAFFSKTNVMIIFLHDLHSFVLSQKRHFLPNVLAEIFLK
jgi:hypothetical protein